MGGRERCLRFLCFLDDADAADAMTPKKKKKKSFQIPEELFFFFFQVVVCC